MMTRGTEEGRSQNAPSRLQPPAAAPPLPSPVSPLRVFTRRLFSSYVLHRDIRMSVRERSADGSMNSSDLVDGRVFDSADSDSFNRG